MKATATLHVHYRRRFVFLSLVPRGRHERTNIACSIAFVNNDLFHQTEVFFATAPVNLEPDKSVSIDFGVEAETPARERERDELQSEAGHHCEVPADQTISTVHPPLPHVGEVDAPAAGEGYE